MKNYTFKATFLAIGSFAAFTFSPNYAIVTSDPYSCQDPNNYLDPTNGVSGQCLPQDVTSLFWVDTTLAAMVNTFDVSDYPPAAPGNDCSTTTSSNENEVTQ
ncbi:MAG: hypothetical protein KI790_01235 [Cyclobacteriaceae bacterium]|nr:hypothetical protein [Cyclobacteriaceae bacterium HetDA_MAG_MS6]